MYGKLVLSNSDEVRLELRQSENSCQIELWAVPHVDGNDAKRLLTVSKVRYGKGFKVVVDAFEPATEVTLAQLVELQKGDE